MQPLSKRMPEGSKKLPIKDKHHNWPYYWTRETPEVNFSKNKKFLNNKRLL